MKLSETPTGVLIDARADAAARGAEGRAMAEVEYLGLENPTAANHCFLNAALQVLWSLEPFRERLLRDAASAAGERGELLAALHALFSRYAEDLAAGLERLRA